jgi:hypothetical protein
MTEFLRATDIGFGDFLIFRVGPPLDAEELDLPLAFLTRLPEVVTAEAERCRTRLPGAGWAPDRTGRRKSHSHV